LLKKTRRNNRTTLKKLDIEDFLIYYRGKLFLPGYFDKAFMPNEKQVIRESSNVMQNPTIKDYPKAASFLLVLASPLPYKILKA